MTMSSNNHQFGDTTLTKMFVGGLAWETQKEALREHFHRYGEILEAVIISDKLTGRSKGYGFVTFKEAEAAKKACEDATPIINGRRANCNLASLGARRPRSLPTPSQSHPQQQQQQQVSNVGARSMSPVQWYYPAPATTQALPYHHHPALPYYGYSTNPTYIATDISYNQKVSYNGGSYINGQYYPGQAVMPMYPLYQYHQSHTMGLPAHIFPSRPITIGPPIISKPNPGATVGIGGSFKMGTTY